MHLSHKDQPISRCGAAAGSLGEATWAGAAMDGAFAINISFFQIREETQFQEAGFPTVHPPVPTKASIRVPQDPAPTYETGQRKRLISSVDDFTEFV